DKRHPDEVVFSKSIEDDLARRDFTVNAIAIDMIESEEPIDPFGGRGDLKKKIIKAVGDAHERFGEDALRLMRAVRLSAQLGFQIEGKTLEAIKKEAKSINDIALERVRDELSKLLMSQGATDGIRLLQGTGLLGEIIPELSEGVGVEQNKHHIYDVFEHNVHSLEYAVEKDFSLDLRLASLLHDVGKVGTREWKNDSRGEKMKNGKMGDWTFYQHQYLGEKLSKDILNRLKYPKEVVKRVALLVREHMFVYDPEVVTEKGVRRLIKRVGEENVDALIKVREADRIGSGVPKAQPYRLRHLQAMIEKAKEEPVGVKQLKVDGNLLIKELQMDPGPRMGQILAVLLEEVIDDPKKNTKSSLTKRAKELDALSDKELGAFSKRAKEAAQEEQKRLDDAIKGKYFVK
ncbi:MAG: HD domain-containing protein, partial [Candidatus Colwellbacteria bacterium]|nr:HD domain-containing protein [Candidatus Colwellbacteria bacterium]